MGIELGDFWLGNKDATYAWESELDILWAPLITSNDRTQFHWKRMDSRAPDDIVFNYPHSRIKTTSEALISTGMAND